MNDKQATLLKQLLDIASFPKAFEKCMLQLHPLLIHDEACVADKCLNAATYASSGDILNALCMHALAAIPKPKLSFALDSKAIPRAEVVSCAAFGSKVTIAVLKGCSAWPKANHYVYQLATYLACVGLRIMMNYENVLSLEKFIVEKLLLQLAKLYSHKTKNSQRVAHILDVLHLRLWLTHQKLCLKKNDTDEFPEHIRLRMENFYRSDQIPMLMCDANNLWSFCRLPRLDANIHSFSYSQLVIRAHIITIQLLIESKQSNQAIQVANDQLLVSVSQLLSQSASEAKALAIFNDQTFRIFWNAGSSVILDKETLNLRLAALPFMIKCAQYGTRYIIQQIYRISIQYERRVIAKTNERHGKIHLDLIFFYESALHHLKTARNLQEVTTEGADLMILMHHLSSLYSQAQQFVEANIALDNALALYSSTHSACVFTKSLLLCNSITLTAQRLELFLHRPSEEQYIAHKSIFMCNNVAPIIQKSLLTQFTTKTVHLGEQHILDLTQSHLKEYCMPIIDLDALCILTESYQMRCFLLQSLRKAGARIFNFIIDDRDKRLISLYDCVQRSFRGLSDLIGAICKKLLRNGAEMGDFFPHFVLLRTKFLRFSASILIKHLPEKLPESCSSLNDSASDLLKILEDPYTKLHVSDALWTEISQWIHDCGIKLTKRIKESDCAAALLLTIFYIGLRCVRKIQAFVETLNSFNSLGLDKLTFALVSFLRPEDVCGMLLESLPYSNSSTQSGGFLDRAMRHYSESMFTKLALCGTSKQIADKSLYTDMEHLHDTLCSLNHELQQHAWIQIAENLECIQEKFMTSLRKQGCMMASSQELILLHACTGALQCCWNRLVQCQSEMPDYWTKMSAILSVKLKISTICGSYYSKPSAHVEAIQSLMDLYHTTKELCEQLVISVQEAEIDLTALSAGCAYNWQCIVMLKILLLCRYFNCGSAVVHSDLGQISYEHVLRAMESSAMYYSKAVCVTHHLGLDNCFNAYIWQKALFEGLETMINGALLIGAPGNVVQRLNELRASALLKAISTSTKKRQSNFSLIVSQLFSYQYPHTETLLVPASAQPEVLSENRICTGFVYIDDQILRAIRHLEVGDTRASYASLSCCASALVDAKAAFCKLGVQAKQIRGACLREIIIRLLSSNIQTRCGYKELSICQLKSALSLCYQAAKHSSVFVGKNPETLNHRTTSGAPSKLMKRSDTAFLDFLALETSSWPVLVLTAATLLRLYTAHSFSGQPERAKHCIESAAILVEKSPTYWLSRHIQYKNIQLLIRWDRIASAQLLLQTLHNPISRAPFSRYLQTSVFENVNEGLQRCELLLNKDAFGEARRELDALWTTVNSAKLTAFRKIKCRLRVRVYRQKIRCFLRSFLLDASTKTLEEIIVCASALQKFVGECTSEIEWIECILELATADLVLFQCHYSHAFSKLRKTRQMLEEAHTRVTRLGIPQYLRQTRLYIGLVFYFLLVKDGVVTKQSPSGLDIESAAGYFLANVFCAADIAMQHMCQINSSTATQSLQVDKHPLDVRAFDLSKGISVQESVKVLSYRLRNMPTSWTILSLVVGTNDNIFLTRITKNEAPMTFMLEKIAWRDWVEKLRNILKESRESLKGYTQEENAKWSKEQKKSWWNVRLTLDERLGVLVASMEEALGFWRYLIKFDTPIANLSDEVDNCISLLLRNCGPKDSVQHKSRLLLSSIIMDPDVTEAEYIACINYISHVEELGLSFDDVQDILRHITQSKRVHVDERSQEVGDGTAQIVKRSVDDIQKMTVSNLSALLKCNGMNSSGTKEMLVERVLAARDRLLLSAARQLKRKRQVSCEHSSARRKAQAVPTDSKSIVLILDPKVAELPWDSLKLFQDFTSVTRMPSLELLLSSMEYHLEKGKDYATISRSSVSYIINPAGDLMLTQSQVSPLLQNVAEWNGLIGNTPSAHVWSTFCLEYDLFVYCGHGAGEKYYHKEDILRQRGKCSAILLFGCSSGKVKQEGIFGPDGAVVSYLEAASPCVLAMLWDVTDKDIDKLSVQLLSEWLLPARIGNEVSELLSRTLMRSRASCKLGYLNGIAAVCYGLPIRVSK